MTHAWHLYRTTHLHYTDCSFWHLPTLKLTNPIYHCLPAAKTTVHTLYYLCCRSAAIHWVLQKAKKAMCVCLTEPGRVKQWLNLCKQSLALLSDCLPAVWAGAWRVLISWHGHGSHMLMCTCVHTEDQSCSRIRTRPGDRFRKPRLITYDTFCALTVSFRTKSGMLLRDDWVTVLESTSYCTSRGCVLILHNLGLQDIASQCEAFHPYVLLVFC